MESTVLAAWVQAVGSVGAIIAAMFIARADRLHAASGQGRERLLVARDHALSLEKAMAAWLDTAANWGNELNNPLGDRMWGASNSLGEALLSLNLPYQIEMLSGLYRELGPAAVPVQRAVIAHRALAKQRRHLLEAGRSGAMLSEDAEKVFADARPLVVAYADAVNRAVAAVTELARI
jgi:hypothetical protein